jgi:hypothetical protein
MMVAHVGNGQRSEIVASKAGKNAGILQNTWKIKKGKQMKGRNLNRDRRKRNAHNSECVKWAHGKCQKWVMRDQMNFKKRATDFEDGQS